jgi:hypothetical protein
MSNICLQSFFTVASLYPAGTHFKGAAVAVACRKAASEIMLGNNATCPVLQQPSKYENIVCLQSLPLTVCPAGTCLKGAAVAVACRKAAAEMMLGNNTTCPVLQYTSKYGVSVVRSFVVAVDTVPCRNPLQRRRSGCGLQESSSRDHVG